MNQKLEGDSLKISESAEKKSALNDAADPRTRDYNESVAAMRASNSNEETNDSLPNC